MPCSWSWQLPFAVRLVAIASFEFKPTIVNHSGGGFHCYWILNQPLNVSEIGEKTLASIKRRVLGHRTTRDDYPVYITDVSTRRNTFVANLVAKVAIEQALQTSEPQQALNAMRALGDPADN